MKKGFKSISCFFITFSFCLNCYSNLIISISERTITYNGKIIISYTEKELSPVLSELLNHQNTKLLFEATALINSFVGIFRIFTLLQYQLETNNIFYFL